MITFLRFTKNPNSLHLIHVLAFIGLLLRIFVAFVSDYIHHPDEIFQYLEQAHRMVFGYGYIPWEYRFGNRSLILPGIISPILYFCKYFKIDDPAIYVTLIKIFFCFTSTSLIYSAYFIGKNLVSENVGKTAAVFCCFWYELLYFSTKPNPEVSATYLFMAAFAIAITKFHKRNPILFGFLCGLTIILRIQYIPVIGSLILYLFFNWRKKEIFKSAVIVLLVIFVAGYIDYLTWGYFFISYYNNYLFNSVYGVSKLFGTAPGTYFFVALAMSSAYVFWITVLLSFTMLRRTWLPLFFIFCVIVPHSFIPHKEYRFILVTIPLILILLSIVVTDGISYFRQPKGRSILFLITIIAFFMITTAGSFFKLPMQNKIYDESLFSKQENLEVYSFLSKEPDLFSVLNAYSIRWCGTGGYYYLHKNVPIYFDYHFDENDNLSLYISHIICRKDKKEIPGFRTFKSFKKLEIRKQTNPPLLYKTLSIDTQNVLQYQIDGKYSPNVLQW